MKKNQTDGKKWEKSIEEILFSLNLTGDVYADHEEYRILIAETFLKIPKDVRDKALSKVAFIVDENFGLTTILSTINTNGKEIVEQPIILLNQLAMEEESRTFKMDVIAHEIAHFTLGHHKTMAGNLDEHLRQEKEADDLIVQWGFNRSNEAAYKDKVK